jgi:hypothetical protein
MIRGAVRRPAVLIFAALALAGCATPKAVPPSAPGAPPSVAIPAAPPHGEPEGYVNLPAAQLRAAFGAPAFVRRDGVTEMWRYDGTACRAFFFLYGDGAARAVRHVETLPRGADSAVDAACLTALRVSPAPPSLFPK